MNKDNITSRGISHFTQSATWIHAHTICIAS